MSAHVPITGFKKQNITSILEAPWCLSSITIFVFKIIFKFFKEIKVAIMYQ